MYVNKSKNGYTRQYIMRFLNEETHKCLKKKNRYVFFTSGKPKLTRHSLGTGKTFITGVKNRAGMLHVIVNY
jgi:hypothetical protein